MLTSFLVSVLLNQAAPAAAAKTAHAASDKPALSATTMAVVDYVLRTDIPDLDPKLVAHFMTVDLDALPKSKREKAAARKLLIEGALQLNKINARKGRSFTASPAVCRPEYHPASYIPVLGLAGYKEIEEQDEEYLEKRTHCTEDGLICGFTLSVVTIPRQSKPPKKRFFLHGRDPLNAFVAEYRSGQKVPTNFFGLGAYSCTK